MTAQNPKDPKATDSRRGAVIGLVAAVLLVIVGWIVVKILGDSGRLQDCAMSGRTNCAPIESGSPQYP